MLDILYHSLSAGVKIQQGLRPILLGETVFVLDPQSWIWAQPWVWDDFWFSLPSRRLGLLPGECCCFCLN